MKAWVVRAWGPPSAMALEDVDEGSPAGDAVRVRMAAVGISFFESLLVAGRYQVRPEFPFIPGWEVAGTVASAPAGSGLQPGQRVAALLDTSALTRGSYAEYADATPHLTFALPASMSFDVGAGFFLNYLTAHFALHRRAQARPDDVVVVHGAAGGVGSAFLQLARAHGCRVLATAGTPEKVELARSLGAELAFNHRDEDWARAVLEHTGGRGADVIFDTVGGQVFERSTKCIAFEGRILIIGFTSGSIASAATNHTLLKNYAVTGVHVTTYLHRYPDLVAAALAELIDLYESGRIQPLVSARYSFEEAPRALEAVATGATVGKVVLSNGHHA